MKKRAKVLDAGTSIVVLLLALLYIYTSASKILNYDKFVFQMRLAPVPLMKTLAPTLGWFMPIVESILAIGLAAGFFYPIFKIKALYASVVLLIIFEIYIGIMLLSGSHLPCTCGGIISEMGWQQHLLFNAFFIISGTMSIRFMTQNEAFINDLYKQTPYKDLSRA
jgi:putative oxidoreductase